MTVLLARILVQNISSALPLFLMTEDHDADAIHAVAQAHNISKFFEFQRSFKLDPCA